MLLSIHPENPEPRKIDQIVDLLRSGGVIIFPTDTVYGLGCDLTNRKAVDKVYALKKVDRRKPMSFICHDLSHLSEYAASVSTPAYRVMKRLLPGPYTFVLTASREVPRMVLTRQRTVGIRVPDQPICQAMVLALGHPILTTSIFAEPDELVTDARDLEDVWGRRVDAVIDGGPLVRSMSSVVDLTGSAPEIIREGKGDVTPFF